MAALGRRRGTKRARSRIVNAAAREGFESASLSALFEEQLLECEPNPIAPCLRASLPPGTLLLKPGSGSGRRVGGCTKKGVDDRVRLEPSALRSRGKPQHWGYFLAADLGSIPLCNESVAGVVFLGAIEHSVEG